MRSAGAQRQEQSNAQFWSNQPDPLQIERGQAKGIQLAREAANPTTTSMMTLVPETKNTQTSEVTAESSATSRIPPMVYVDDEGLQEQFLMEDEVSQEVMDITANKVTTLVDTEDDAAPLNPIYTQRSQQEEDLGLQPSRGPREESMGELINDFLDENMENTNFSITGSDCNIPRKPTLPLGWVVPDGTNQTLEEINEKKVANGMSPGGGSAGAIITTLQNLNHIMEHSSF